MLRIAGVMTAPGFLITYLHAQFDPANSKFVLQFRGMAEGKKLTYFRQSPRTLMDKNNEPSVLDHIGERPEWVAHIAIASYPIRNLRKEISCMMPNFISERGQISGKNPPAHSPARPIREPYGGAYLMWLDQHVHEQVVVMSNVSIEDGRLVLL